MDNIITTTRGPRDPPPRDPFFPRPERIKILSRSGRLFLRALCHSVIVFDLTTHSSTKNVVKFKSIIVFQNIFKESAKSVTGAIKIIKCNSTLSCRDNDFVVVPSRSLCGRVRDSLGDHQGRSLVD